MIKIILESPERNPGLFILCKVLFREGKSTFRMEELSVAPVGNSLTWRYFIDDSGRATFFRIDSKGYAVIEGTGPSVAPGNYIWFESDSYNTTWGFMTPPKNVFRRVFWERGYSSRKELFHFNCSPKEIMDAIHANKKAFYEDRERILKEVPESSWANVGGIEIYARGGDIAVFADLIRDWDHQAWSFNGIYVLKGCATGYFADKILDRVKDHSGLVVNACSLRG